MTRLPHSTLDRLRSVIRGQCWLPEDAEFEHMRHPWNLAIEQQPLAVIEAADAEDVMQVVRFAAGHRVSVATQPSGHGATGRTANAILLRTSRLDAIEIDPTAKTARIGAGVRSGELQRAAAEHGLTALPGSSPVVSVIGAALGGGLSWFSRSFGWMADSILAADIITADGTAHHVSSTDEPELFWAMRGGGGDLAIVVALELRLHAGPSLYGGRQLWRATHAAKVAEAYRAMTETAPDALTLWLELLCFPGAEPMIAIDSAFLGTEVEGRRLMRPTASLPEPLSDSRALMGTADLGQITAEPTDPGPGRSRGELLTRLDEATLSVLVDKPIEPLMTVQIRHLGGALTRGGDSPHGALHEPYAVYMFGVPTTPAVSEEIGRKHADLAQSLPISGRKPITFLNPSERLADALPDASLRRLVDLKNEHDPLRIVQGNFAILETDDPQ